MPVSLFRVQKIILVWRISHTRKESPGTSGPEASWVWAWAEKKSLRDKFIGTCLAPWAAEVLRREYRKRLRKQPRSGGKLGPVHALKSSD